MNRHRRLIATFVIAASLAAGGAYLAREHGGRSVSSLFAPDRHLRFAIDLPRGAEYAYDVAWTTKSDLYVPALAGGRASPTSDGSVHADVAVAGELALRSYGPRAGAFLVGARLSKLTQHRLAIFGQDALQTDAQARDAFDGREALVEIDPAGSVRAFHFAKDDPPIFKEVMRTILTDAQVHVLANGDEGWSAQELSSIGRGTSRYDVDAIDPPRITRTRAGWDAIASLPGRAVAPADQRAESTATIELEPRGFVRSIEARDAVSVKSADGKRTELATSTALSLRLIEVRAWDAPTDVDLSKLETRAPGEVVASAESGQRLLERRAEGMTLGEVERGLATLAATGKLPEDRGWLKRSTALLQLHPEHCMDLAALFESKEMNGAARAQILDLLAGAGTPQAQEAMRAALESPQARAAAGGPSYGALLQRFSSVARPTRESFDFAADAYASASSKSDRFAAAYALGGVAGNLRAGGDVARAKAASDALRRDLEKARDATERKHLCAALGNVALPSDVTTFASLARDDDAGVRAAAAWALHKIDAPDARDALIDLAADADGTVAGSAFDAMRYETLGADDWRHLADRVTKGATPQSADGALLTLLTAHVDGGAPVRDMLNALLARSAGDNPMQARIRHLLAQMG